MKSFLRSIGEWYLYQCDCVLIQSTYVDSYHERIPSLVKALIIHSCVAVFVKEFSLYLVALVLDNFNTLFLEINSPEYQEE